MSEIEPTGYCVECDAITHPYAYFCGVCAGEFYNEGGEDNDD